MTRLRLRYALPVVAVLVLLGFSLVLPRSAGAAAKTYTIPGNAVFPEGIAYDSTSDYFYVSSTTDGTIFRAKTTDTAMTSYLAAGGDGRTSATGMKVDSQGRLFVSGASTGALFVYNTEDGKLIKKFQVATPPNTFINDVALTSDDQAFFTDSTSPNLYRVYTNNNDELVEETFLTFTGTPLTYQSGFNLNGIVVTSDDDYLIVTQSNTSKLFRITIADKSIVEINLNGQKLSGDGLLLDGQTLYAVRTGTSGARELATFTLSADYKSATLVKTFTDPSFGYPTTIATTDDQVLVVNSQFDKRSANPNPVLPFTISSIPLEALQAAPTTPGTTTPATTAATTPGTPATTTAVATAAATTAPATTAAATAVATTAIAPAATSTAFPTATPPLPGFPDTGNGSATGGQGGLPLAPFALALLLAVAVLTVTFVARARRQAR